MEQVERKIEAVEGEIGAVAQQIKDVERLLDAKPTNPEEVAYLRKKEERLGKREEQLRDEKNKLLEEKAQLRRKEEKLLDPSGPAASCCFFILGCAH